MPTDTSNPSNLLKFNEKANFALLDTPEGLFDVNGYADNGLYNQMDSPFNGGFTGWNYFTPWEGEDHNDWVAGGSGSDTLVGDTDGDLSCIDEDDPSKGDDTHNTDTADVLYGGSGFFLDPDDLQDFINSHDADIPPGANDGENSTQPPSFDNTLIGFDIGDFDLANIFSEQIELGLYPNIDFAGDELIGGRHDDIVFGQRGNDTIDGGGGSDYLFGGRDWDLMDGDYLGNERDGNSDFTGNTGTFTLDSPNDPNGFDGAEFDYDTADYRQDGAFCDDGDEGDFMFGGRGKDTMYGGDDSMSLSPLFYTNDWYKDSSGIDACYVYHGVWNWDGDWMSGGGGRDVMNGEAGFDTMYGNNCNDEMRGSYHYDLMYGGKGSDYMLGGTEATADGGEDTGDFASPGYRVFGNDCEYRCSYEGLYDGEVAAPALQDGLNQYRGGDTMFGGRGFDTMWGGAGDDLMYGGRHSDCMYGGNDDDRMLGQGHSDFMSGGDGWDDMSGGRGNDTMNGDAGDDYMAGNADDDLMGGGTGRDFMHGNDGNDSMSGDGSYASGKLDGTITIDGDLVPGGNDVMYGEAGNDTMDGNGGNDVMFGGTGMDLMTGGEGNDTMYGNEDMDVMYGNSGNDCMHGNDGRDFLDGGEGNDTLDGGAGTDTVIGGDGDDLIYIAAGEGGSVATLPETITGGGGQDESGGSDTFVYSATYEEFEDENGDFYSTATGDSGYVYITDFGRDDVLQLCIDGEITECCTDIDVNNPFYNDYENINERLIDSLSHSDTGNMGIRVYDMGPAKGTAILFDDTLPNGQDPSEPEFHNDEYIWLEGVSGIGEGNPYTSLWDLVQDGYDIRISNAATQSGGNEESPNLREGWDDLVDCTIQCGDDGCDIDPFAQHPIDDVVEVLT